MEGGREQQKEKIRLDKTGVLFRHRLCPGGDFASFCKIHDRSYYRDSMGCIVLAEDFFPVYFLQNMTSHILYVLLLHYEREIAYHI